VALRKEPPAKPRPATPQEQLEEFAKDLRDLRGRTGLGYPEMAELSHYTMKTLASAAGGLNLPTLPVTMAYVRACDGSAPEWEDRWHRLADALKSAGDEPGPAEGEKAPADGGSRQRETARDVAGNAGPPRDPGDGQGDEGQVRRERGGRPRPSQVSTPQPAQPGVPVQEQEPLPPPPSDQVYVITSAAPRRPRR
jgi:hypothetical protein